MAFFRRETTLLTFALAMFAAAPASASWHVKQSHATPGGSGPQTSDLYYFEHMLRLDNPDQTSMLIDLTTGTLTFINHASKERADVTIQELVALRNKIVGEMKSQLQNMPPQVQEMMKKQIEDMEKSMDAISKPTKANKKETVHGVACEVYTWEGGEACVANKLPVDMTAFKKDTAKLAKKLADAGVKGEAAMEMVYLSKYGFPVRTKRIFKLGPQTIETTTEVTEIKSAKLSKDKFKAPADYAKQDFETLMQKSMGGPR